MASPTRQKSDYISIIERKRGSKTQMQNYSPLRAVAAKVPETTYSGKNDGMYLPR